MRKSTNNELVAELEKRNADGRYDEMIRHAKENWYHDYKNPGQIICGKALLMEHLTPFPELQFIVDAVIAGEYDEEPDEEDKAMLRKDLPEAMWPMFGL